MEKAAAEWHQLSAEKKKIEARCEDLKPVLEKALRKAEGKTRWSLLLVEFDRENFKLKDAKAALGEETLAPFISFSPVVQIRPTHSAKKAA